MSDIKLNKVIESVTVRCSECGNEFIDRKPEEVEDSKIFLDEARYPGLTRQKASAMIEEVNEFLANGG